MGEKIRKEELIMKKKLLVSLAVGVLAVAALTGCGSKSGSSKGNTLKVAASATPHAELLEQAKPILAEQGITLY